MKKHSLLCSPLMYIATALAVTGWSQAAAAQTLSTCPAYSYSQDAPTTPPAPNASAVGQCNVTKSCGGKTSTWTQFYAYDEPITYSYSYPGSGGPITKTINICIYVSTTSSQSFQVNSWSDCSTAAANWCNNYDGVWTGYMDD